MTPALRRQGLLIVATLATAYVASHFFRAANVTIVCGDGSQGYPEAAPYDAISVAAGAPDVPYQLLEQLRDPGRMVIPVGPMGDQELRLISKRDGKVESRVASYCRFVPLRGDQGWRKPPPS